MRYLSLWQHFLVNITLITSLFLFSGCSQTGEMTTEKPRFVIVLVDETDSFALYKKGQITTMFWPEVLPWMAKIVKTLQPGEKFCVIGIDEHGFDTDDVRIPIKTLDENPLRAIQQKKKMSKEVEGLTRRKEKHRSTDILGTLYHAAHFLNRQGKYQGVIAIFSDMKQEPNPPTLKQASDLRFHKDTDLHCFYVNASGRSQWEATINTWVPIFEQAGLEGTENNFYQRGEMDGRFDEVFPGY